MNRAVSALDRAYTALLRPRGSIQGGRGSRPIQGFCRDSLVLPPYLEWPSAVDRAVVALFRVSVEAAIFFRHISIGRLIHTALYGPRYCCM